MENEINPEHWSILKEPQASMVIRLCETQSCEIEFNSRLEDERIVAYLTDLSKLPWPYSYKIFFNLYKPLRTLFNKSTNNYYLNLLNRLENNVQLLNSEVSINVISLAIAKAYIENNYVFQNAIAGFRNEVFWWEMQGLIQNIETCIGKKYLSTERSKIYTQVSIYPLGSYFPKGMQEVGYPYTCELAKDRYIVALPLGLFLQNTYSSSPDYSWSASLAMAVLVEEIIHCGVEELMQHYPDDVRQYIKEAWVELAMQYVDRKTGCSWLVGKPRGRLLRGYDYSREAATRGMPLIKQYATDILSGNLTLVDAITDHLHKSSSIPSTNSEKERGTVPL